MKKRIFVAINLPGRVKKKIEQEVENLTSSYRFLPPENWHLTLSFLGYQDDHSLSLIINTLKETANKFESPLIEFEKIIYGPPKKTPRMIWLLGSPETSSKLSIIKNSLEDALIDNGVRFRHEQRPYTSHLTLARFESRAKSSLSTIEKELPLKFEAESLDLMESHLRRTGAQYEALSRFNFLT